MEELKRCPFCAVEPQRKIGGIGKIVGREYYVIPHKRECILYENFGQIITNKHYETWNTRANGRGK